MVTGGASELKFNQDQNFTYKQRLHCTRTGKTRQYTAMYTILHVET